MAKKTKPTDQDPQDIEYYLHQPHDKYVRALLQHRPTALQVIEYALGPELFQKIDVQTLKLTNASYIDEKLQINLADICYEGRTKDGEAFRICILFEHKSDLEEVYEQLTRYISNVWVEDKKQKRGLTLSIPILIHHGAAPRKKETPQTLFPTASPDLLSFVPAFDYILLDVAALSEETIENLQYMALRNVFFALKYSRNEEYLALHWKKIIIFASVFTFDKEYHYLVHATFAYMISVSKTIQKNMENIDTLLSPEEKSKVPPFVYGKYYLKGREEGVFSTIKQYMLSVPTATNEQISSIFLVDIEFVQSVRASIQAEQQ